MIRKPTTTSDLQRIDAQVRVTCTSCKATEVWELPALIAEVRNNDGNTDWHTARYAIKCPRRCASPIIKLLPIPYGRQRARRQAHRHALINLSLQILREAAGRSAHQAVGTIEVRLALHVLRGIVRDQAVLNAFWSAATVQPRHTWTSCQMPYRAIVERLVEQELPVDPENRP